MKRYPVICVIDDDESVRSSLANYLRAAGREVRTFESAASFLASPDRGETGCLVTDLHMPGMDGLALQQQLNHIGRAFPVIVITAYPTAAARERSAELGAAAFLEKPVDPDGLLERIDAILSGRETTE
ncbi:FixJ family two-component response regulator [Sphingopyxis sp. OAS728]|uniref:response regulator transcription factor n=1 Tax=Sphingopyxis sp. OAS728 TaxID=2663823 RepID=UPI00178BB23E|nr:response regulator [Sphingopyxis sp. OAS728]MBE1527272.1 FixJ family two-component response regulator [Sphingopyxis sp. OAS728]